MRVNGPPELMPWIRDTNTRLDTVERALGRLGGVLSASYAVSADARDVLASPLGTTPDLMLLPNNAEPTLEVISTTGQLRVTVTAFIEATRNSTVAAYATGIFRVSLSPISDASLGGGRAPIGLTGGGLIKTFNYAANQGGPMGESGSHSRTLKLGNGRYSIHSEYVYFHSNATIGIRWSQCSITAEPI